MKKVFPLILAMLAAACMPRIGCAYFGMESIPYSIVISGNTLEEIVCQAALVFHGIGYWEEAEVITAGCEILENQVLDCRQVVSASVMVGSYDVDEGVPREAGSGFYPVRLTLQKDADGRYVLLSYLYPEDGTLYAKQSKALFSGRVYGMLFDAEQKSRVVQCAWERTLAQAQNFIRAQNGKRVWGVWRQVLKPGSNGRARELLKQHEAWNGNYPCFEGFVIWHDVLYQLSVEGEHSYSGKLHFSIFEPSGAWTESVVQVQNNGEVQQYN